jgi:hypothetical protein
MANKAILDDTDVYDHANTALKLLSCAGIASFIYNNIHERSKEIERGINIEDLALSASIY